MQGISINTTLRRMERRYILRSNDTFLVRVLLSPATRDMRNVIMFGAPGTGKTFFAECLAYGLGGKTTPHGIDNLVRYQFHAWTTNEELQRGVNLAAFSPNLEALKGEPVFVKGVLWRAAESSKLRPTVLLLDEIDKCMERSEDVLLEFLESGSFVLPDGTVVRANLDNLITVITTNETRELREATLRRCYRHRMEFLPRNKEAAMLAALTGRALDVATAAVDAAWKVRDTRLSSPSTKELRYFLNDLALCRSADEVAYAISGRLLKLNELKPDAIAAYARNLLMLLEKERKQ